jgi:hypothetical protein
MKYGQSRLRHNNREQAKVTVNRAALAIVKLG